VTGLRELSSLQWWTRSAEPCSVVRASSSKEAAWMILALCGAHFALWYGVHVFDVEAMLPYETWDAINHTNPERRIAVNQALAEVPGRQLVIVRYSPRHIFQEEWVYNAADIDGARVVWARDLGHEQNRELLNYYPDRNVWLLEPDEQPPSITPYVQ
jgi:hypothetical protein